MTGIEAEARAIVSRKTVNAALQRFEKSRWLKTGYRSITVTNLDGLCEYAEGAGG